MMRAALLLWMTPLLLLFVAPGARAMCRYQSGGNVSVVFALPTTIPIAAGTPDNTVFFTSAPTSPASNPPAITCGFWAGNSGNWQEKGETMTYGVINLRSGYLADNLTYATGLPGISYRIMQPLGTYLTAYPPGNSQFIYNETFNTASILQLVKTGPIMPGSVLAAGKLGDWQWADSSGSPPLIPETFQLGNSVTFTTPSCTLVANPINVILPTTSTNVFMGVGATSGKTPFQIQLSCPTGTAVTRVTMHTTTPDSHTGVVAPAGAGYATGIGVQILDSNSNPVTFEAQSAVTPAAAAAISYYAQYFQTASAVSSGQVKATVTFDLFYQ